MAEQAKAVYFVADDEDQCWERWRRLLVFRTQRAAQDAVNHARPKWDLHVFRMTLTDVTEPNPYPHYRRVL